MTSSPNARVLSVNLAVVRPNPYKGDLTTGIDKRPTEDAVHVRAPGTKQDGLGSGLVGDSISDRRAHGGDDQAVYAYAREDLDRWSLRLTRDLPSGSFGENLTTEGIDVTGAVIGERWRVGAVELVVRSARMPCRTFQDWMGEPQWVKRFTDAGAPGAYLSVAVPGAVEAGDEIVVMHRPDHGVTVHDAFKGRGADADRLRLLLDVEDLAPDLRARLGRIVSTAGL